MRLLGNTSAVKIRQRVLVFGALNRRFIMAFLYEIVSGVVDRRCLNPFRASRSCTAL